MLDDIVKDYSAYLKLDISSGVLTVQDVIDNMLTRLEELTSVIQMIKVKNTECNSAISEDINKYRSEVTTLSRKIATLNRVLQQLQNNVDILEKQVEKAELDFGISNDYKLTNFLKPFLNRKQIVNRSMTQLETIQFDSVMSSFEEA